MATLLAAQPVRSRSDGDGPTAIMAPGDLKGQGGRSRALDALRPFKAAAVPRIDPAFELRGRHPELARQQPLAGWMAGDTLRSWAETAPGDDGSRVVTCTRRGSDEMFVGVVLTDPGRFERVLSTKLLTPRDANRRKPALKGARALRDTDRIVGYTPRCDDLECNIVTWRIELVDLSGMVRQVEFERGTLVGRQDTPECARRGSASGPALVAAATRPAGSGCSRAVLVRQATSTPYLDSDELHHVDEFLDAAQRWGGTSADPATIAEELVIAVNAHFSYDATDRDVGNLTLADHPACICLQQRGQCDELAVFLTTLLRARGIQAREVLVTGEINTRPVAHALVEWSADGVAWTMADPTWLGLGAPVIAQPEIYRNNGLGFPCVTRPGEPVDAVSNLVSNGTPDPDGDDAINPLCDWHLSAGLPGILETAYSGAATQCAAMSSPPCGRASTP